VGHVAHAIERLLVVNAVNQDCAFRRLIEAGDHAQQSRLARAVLSAQHIESPRLQRERNFSYRSGAAINLGDVFSADRRSVGSRQRRTSVSFRWLLGGWRCSGLLLLRSVL
jgi:lipopolysaccharide biosynthesis protein